MPEPRVLSALAAWRGSSSQEGEGPWFSASTWCELREAQLRCCRQLPSLLHSLYWEGMGISRKGKARLKGRAFGEGGVGGCLHSL